MFKAVITEKTTIMNGRIDERLAGLVCYIDALLDMGISKQIIKKVIEIPFEKKENDNTKVETILDNDKMKIQKFNLNGLNKEEATKLLEEELFNKLFD